MARASLLLILVLALVQSSFAFLKPPSCRCLSSDAGCWPHSRVWSKFNSSLHGQLLVVKPPAWPCHDPHYDDQACQVAMDKWKNPFWRSDQPGAMMEPNWEVDEDGAVDRGCFISGNRSSVCYQGDVPVYAVNVTQIFQVQLAVKFARQHNLRLVTRNTGHDYLGRSTAKGSLSIWLHHLQDIVFHQEDFLPEHCGGGQKMSAVTVGAGVQWDDLYSETAQHKRVIVGGGCSSVGAAGGYPQGGGHSPISPAFGLAADNILEYKVVTADGKLRIANRCQNKDLFWALRGGGGGTFGIVVSATYKTHPDFDGVIFAGFNITAKDKPSMRKFLEHFSEMNPSLSEAGWFGYFILSRQNMDFRYLLPNANMTIANRTLQPLSEYIEREESGLTVNGGLLPFASFEEFRLKVLCGGQSSCRQLNGSDGVSVALASRLIPKDKVVSSSKQLADAFLTVIDLEMRIAGAQVAGGRVSEPQDNAVNPAWRKAAWLVIMSVTWNDNATRSDKEAQRNLLTNANKLFKDITPGSGSYMNEADYNEPDYRHSFYGDHYSKLYAIKQKVDPTGLFVCHHCVGSENWGNDLNCRLVT